MSNKKSLIVMIGSTIFAAIAMASVTIAWFSPAANTSTGNNPIEGVVQDKYYNSGDGLTPKTAFEITQPRHLYNLAWLQYLGFYNKNSGPDNHQFYFKLGNNIDMSQFASALPPIGSELNPFVGNFDGHGYVISGLRVSNDFDDFTWHPSVISGWDDTDPERKQPHIVGLFGIVGDYAGGNKPTTYTNSINAFVNTGIAGATIKTAVKDSLMGIAVGYSSGNLANIVVDESTLDVAKKATIQGTTTAYSNYSNISDFTLVGYTTKTKQIKKLDETIYGINSSSGYEFNGAEQGATTGWGGSIDMMSVTKRLQAIRSTVSGTNFVYHKTVNHYQGEEDTETNTKTDTNFYTYLKNDNDEIGHFNFIGNSSQTIMNRYALLGGGHFETHNNYAKVEHTGQKISDGDGHYLTINSITANSGNNAGTITNCADTSSDVASVWNVPNSGNGYISAAYNYNHSNNSTTYYLYWTGSVIRLSADTSNRTQFTREERNGKIRFIYDSKYLGYSNSTWTMLDIPQILDEPEEPVQNPIAPQVPDYNSYLSDSYQIAYDDGTNYHYLSTVGNSDTSRVTEMSPSSTYGWKFKVNGSDINILTAANNTRNIYVYTVIDNVEYYIREGSSSVSYRYYLQQGTSGANTFTKTNNSGLITLKSSSSTGANNYYLCYNTDHHAFEDRSSTDVNKNALTIRATRTILEDEYNAAKDIYDEQIKYRDETYPVLKENYDKSVEAYNATYKLSLTNATVYGPDEKLSNTNGTGMYYDEDDVTYFPLSTVNDDNRDYRPADNNTAYVVGGSSITANTNSYDDELTCVRFGYYPIQDNISNDFNTSTSKFDHIYTVDYQGNNLVRKEITNDTANYNKLTATKRNLETVMQGQTNVYGLHFMESTISMNALTTAKYIKVNREIHNNYELPVNSIDFNLKEFGYINFLAGSYYTYNETRRNNSFFSLYQIERLDSSPNKINRILEIKKVYEHSSKDKSYSYVYELTDGNLTFYTKPYRVVDAEGNKEWLNDSGQYTKNQYVNSLPTGYVSIFDCARIKMNTIASGTFDNHAYYFEIPMNDGEFCLGSVGGAIGSYLMYLDIGANASKFQRTIFYEHFLSEVKTYAYPEGVSLKTLPKTYGSEAVVPISPAVSVDDSDSACVKVTAGYKDTLTIDRNDDDVSLKRTVNTSNAPPIYQGESVSSLHDYGSSNNLNVTSLSSLKKEYKRMTYYDVNVNLNAVTVTVVTDVKIDNGNYLEANRTIEQKIYSGKNTNVNPSATYIYDSSAGVDQRENMKVYNTNTGIRLSDANLLSFTALGIDDANLSSDTTGIITYRLIGEDYTRTIVLNAVIDNNNQSGSYYIYDGYLITIIPTSESVTVNIKKLDSDKVIYIGSTEVTNVGQQIVIAVP